MLEISISLSRYVMVYFSIKSTQNYYKIITSLELNFLAFDVRNKPGLSSYLYLQYIHIFSIFK